MTAAEIDQHQDNTKNVITTRERGSEVDLLLDTMPMIVTVKGTNGLDQGIEEMKKEKDLGQEIEEMIIEEEKMTDRIIKEGEHYITSSFCC